MTLMRHSCFVSGAFHTKMSVQLAGKLANNNILHFDELHRKA